MKAWAKLSALLALGVGLCLLAMLSFSAGASDPELMQDSFADFRQGTLDRVDIWSEPGVVKLDRFWWSDRMVNDLANPSPLAFLPNDREYPRLSFAFTTTAGTTSTVFFAVWQDERSGDTNPDIFFDRSLDNGHTWTDDITVTAATGYQIHPDVTFRKTDKSICVVWKDGTHNLGFARSYDWGQTWTVSTIYTSSREVFNPRIAPHGESGYLYLVWGEANADGNPGPLYVSRSEDGGATWSTPITLSTTALQRGTPPSAASLTVDGDGNVYVVWKDTDPADSIYFTKWISGSVWNASGWETPIRLREGTLTPPAIAIGRQNILYVAWVELLGGNYAVMVAYSQDQGETWDYVQVAAPVSANDLSAPDVGADPVGRVYVVWYESGDGNIYIAESKDGGISWTPKRRLNSESGVTTAAYPAPALKASFDGSVVAAWHAYPTGSGSQIYATGYPSDRYFNGGEYLSPVFDTGGPASWGTITWTATVSPGTGLQIATRVMTAPGASWTDWYTYSHSGESIPHPSGQFIQYRAVFTSTGADTAVLDKVVISYEQYRVFLPLVLKSG